MLGDVRERLGADEPGGALDLLVNSNVGHLEIDGHWAAFGQRGKRGREPATLHAAGMQPGGQISRSSWSARSSCS